MTVVDKKRSPRPGKFGGTPLGLVLHARVVTGAGGGPEKTILNSPHYLREHGYDCICLYLRPPADDGFEIIRQRAAEREAPLVEIDDRGAWDWRVLRRVLDVCRRDNVTVWHGHDYKTNLLGLLLRRWHLMHLVTTVHGWVHHTNRTPLYYALDRWALRRYDRVICVSADLAAECCREGVPKDRVVHIDNAIDAVRFTRQRSIVAAQQELGWPAGRLLIGAVGRLAEEKGFDLLIRAAAKLSAEGRDVGVAIAGDGPEQARLEQLSRDLGCPDRVRLMGFQADLKPFYEAMDIYALSSRREGLPNVLLEAMALDVPVIATRVAGVPTLIDDGKNGLLIDGGSVDALAVAIGRLADDVELREGLAVAGRATVLNRYSFAARMAKVAAVYDDVLHTCGASRAHRR
jgi:glycosyltransferase involved in cell wall biosynthesis